MERIKFDSKFLKENSQFISISTALNMIEEGFDADAVISKNYDKWQSDESNKYYGLTPDQIKDIWESKAKQSTDYGSKLDDYIKECLTGDDISKELWEMDNNREGDKRLDNICISFDDFKKDFLDRDEIIFIDREQTLYYEFEPNKYIMGRFDALFYNKKTNKYIIIDWKSSGEINKVANRWTKKMLGPANILDQLNYTRYTLQTHTYKLALIKNYLPKDTKPEDILTFIVDLPGNKIQDSDKMYDLCSEAIPYNEELLNNIFKFAFKKKELLKRKNK